MTRPRILVVGGNPQHREVYVRSLAAIDAEVVEVEAGRDALAAAQEREFALVLIDIRMRGRDGVDGFEVAAMLRGDPRAAAAPLLFVATEDDSQQSHKMAYRMGAAGVLLNVSADPEILRLKVRAFLDMDRRKAEIQQRISELESDLDRAKQELATQKREIETVRRQATNDLLTGLPNRLLFEDRVHGALIRARRTRRRVGLAYLDLDGVKPINERFGKASGEEVLAAVSRRLVTTVRASDTVARLGTEEFALVLEGLDSAASGEFVGKKVLDALSAPYPLKDPETGQESEVTLGVSVGLALSPDHADNRNDLLMLADMAMYAIKREGGGLRIAARPPQNRNSVVSPVDFRQRNQ